MKAYFPDVTESDSPCLTAFEGGAVRDLELVYPAAEVREILSRIKVHCLRSGERSAGDPRYAIVAILKILDESGINLAGG